MFRKVVDTPSLLEVLSYTFYYNTSMCGPAVEFADFFNYIYKKNESSNIPQDKAIKEGFEDLIICIGFMAAKLTLSSTFNMAFLITDEFYYKNYFYKFFYVYFTMSLLRIKYYIGWKMAQSTLTFAGVSYNPRQEKKAGTDESNFKFNSVVTIDAFDKHENCTLSKTELEINPKIKIQVLIKVN
jgi:hypothetical protein